MHPAPQSLPGWRVIVVIQLVVLLQPFAREKRIEESHFFLGVYATPVSSKRRSTCRVIFLFSKIFIQMAQNGEILARGDDVDAYDIEKLLKLSSTFLMKSFLLDKLPVKADVDRDSLLDAPINIPIYDSCHRSIPRR